MMKEHVNNKKPKKTDHFITILLFPTFFPATKEEIDKILGPESEIFCRRFGVTQEGNWEHKNILNVQKSWAELSMDTSLEIEKLEQMISDGLTRLMEVRQTRVRPATDDKILLGWNAVLLTAFCKYSAASGNEFYKNEAIELYHFLDDNFSEKEVIRYHSFKNKIAKQHHITKTFQFFNIYTTESLCISAVA